MKFSKTIITAAALVLGGIAVAAPTADEIKQLGTTLTPWGAEKAGNKDGTIPQYTGGEVKTPPNYNYKSGVMPNPYPEDKVLFWIDAKNMDKYADKLSPGVQAQFKKSPATFRIAVYPSRRTASYPKDVLDNSIKNATRCSIKDEGNTLDASRGCRGGFPFPQPKTGYEAMWDHFSAYWGPARLRDVKSYMVKSTGESVWTLSLYSYEDNQLYDKDTATPWRHHGIKTEYYGPTRLVGNATLMYDSLTQNERKAWSYTSAARRTRLAPDYAGDMPVATTGGSMLYDQIYMFLGSLDKFDWALVGKQEMYIPYNNYNLTDSPPKQCTQEGGLMPPNHPNPDCIRWELHRVWHIKGTLKQDKRHLFARRDLYFDEDTWAGGLAEGYDHGDKLYIVQWMLLRPDYVKHAPALNEDYLNFDLNSGTYFYPFTLRAWAFDKPLRNLTSDNITNFVLKPPN